VCVCLCLCLCVCVCGLSPEDGKRESVKWTGAKNMLPLTGGIETEAKTSYRKKRFP
jgi:hypothetical protein